MSDEESCRAHLSVVRASATYKTPLFKGKPIKKDAVIDVELTSTATAPISSVELGVFLGASLREIEETRPSALPTARPRDLQDGGVAFRAEAVTLIHPGATRVVRVEKSTLPLDRDFSTVTAVVASCRTLEPVGEATIGTEKIREDPTVSGISIAAALLAVAIVLVLLVRSFR